MQLAGVRGSFEVGQSCGTGLELPSVLASSVLCSGIEEVQSGITVWLPLGSLPSAGYTGPSCGEGLREASEGEPSASV